MTTTPIANSLRLMADRPADGFGTVEAFAGDVASYLTDREVARRLRLAPKTLRNKVAAGIFREGEHFFRPPGMTRRWKWSAVVAWVEGSRHDTMSTDVIRLARSSVLRG